MVMVEVELVLVALGIMAAAVEVPDPVITIITEEAVGNPVQALLQLFVQAQVPRQLHL